MSPYHSFKRYVCACILFQSVLLGLVSARPELPWTQKSSFYFAQDMDLREAIQNYGSLQGFNVAVDRAISSKINGKFEDISPEEFFNRISKAHGLSWYYDGGLIHVGLSQNNQSTYLDMDSLAANRLLATLDSQGVVAPGTTLNILANQGIVFVSGPAGYVQMVEQLAEKLSSSIRVAVAEKPVIRIFPLKYAWAYDTSFTSQESTVVIPGVVSLLRGLMEEGTDQLPSVVISGQERKPRVPVTEKVETFKRKYKLDEEQDKTLKIAKNTGEEVTLQKQGQAKDSASAPGVRSRSATLIQPDMRLNAIIVRDVQEKMPQYEEIIASLDVPTHLIEIGVTIVDVNKNMTRELGNKLLQGSSLSNTNKSFELNFTNSKGTSILTDGFNFKGTTVVDGQKIISQLLALETSGSAHTLARPSVLTLNNIEAYINNSQSFYVALAGNNSSDLATVTASTSVRVTPRVIQGDDGLRKIKLFIQIDNGSIGGDASAAVSATSIPRVNNSSLQTQAVIWEGQSLLVGGFYNVTNETTNTGVPILKDLPLVGYAFKVKKRIKSTTERLFLIQPRVIDLNYEVGVDLKPYFHAPVKGIGDRVRDCCYPEVAHKPKCFQAQEEHIQVDSTSEPAEGACALEQDVAAACTPISNKRESFAFIPKQRARALETK